VAKRPAQLRYVHLDSLGRTSRRTLRPQLVDQALAGNDLVGVQEQDHQHHSLLETPQRKHTTVTVNHLKRSKKTKPNLSISPNGRQTTTSSARKATLAFTSLQPRLNRRQPHFPA
jgi:hypothetical protein